MAEQYALALKPVPPQSGSEFFVNPPSDVQLRFFQEALAERNTQAHAATGEYRGRAVHGPHYAVFEAIRAAQTDEAAALRARHELGHARFTPLLRDQTQTPLTFTTPSATRTYGEGGVIWGLPESGGTSNACFRMVIDSLIPGWQTDEAALTTALAPCAEDAEPDVIRDHHYLNILESAVFQRVSRRRVQTAIVAGADLGFLHGIAAQARERRPGTHTYCVASIEHTRRAHQARSVMVTQAHNRVVHIRDTNPNAPRAYAMGGNEWSWRWAACSNVAMLILAQPPRARG